MRKLFFALILTLAACSQAPSSTMVSRPSAGEQGFVTVEAAVTAGIQAAVASSTKFERGGGIILGTDGKYYYTMPVGGSDPGEVKFEVEFPKSFKVVALYHTHPAEGGVDTDVTEYFSGMDIETATNLHLVSYIGIIKNHSISKFVPGHDTVQSVDANKGDGTSTNVSLGEPVGTF